MVSRSRLLVGSSRNSMFGRRRVLLWIWSPLPLSTRKRLDRGGRPSRNETLHERDVLEGPRRLALASACREGSWTWRTVQLDAELVVVVDTTVEPTSIGARCSLLRLLGEQIEQRGLADPVRADDPEPLARADIEIDPVQHQRCGFAGDGEIDGFDDLVAEPRCPDGEARSPCAQGRRRASPSSASALSILACGFLVRRCARPATRAHGGEISPDCLGSASACLALLACAARVDGHRRGRTGFHFAEFDSAWW